MTQLIDERRRPAGDRLPKVTQRLWGARTSGEFTPCSPSLARKIFINLLFLNSFLDIVLYAHSLFSMKTDILQKVTSTGRDSWVWGFDIWGISAILVPCFDSLSVGSGHLSQASTCVWPHLSATLQMTEQNHVSSPKGRPAFPAQCLRILQLDSNGAASQVSHQPCPLFSSLCFFWSSHFFNLCVFVHADITSWEHLFLPTSSNAFPAMGLPSLWQMSAVGKCPGWHGLPLMHEKVWSLPY
jgi:hypothetical protein